MHRAPKNRRFVGADRGAATVELALLLPLVMLIVCGIIDFGGMLHAQVTLTQAAREGSRVAALQPAYDYAEINARTRSAAVSPLLTEEDITVEAPPTCPEEPDAVVEVIYDFEFITPVGGFVTLFGGEGFDSSTTLSARGVMPCES